MKTITLTDEAYGRLIEWKGSPKESFSKVVLKVVPKKGTLGQMIEDLSACPPLTSKQAKVMEESVSWGRDPNRFRDSWNS